MTASIFVGASLPPRSGAGRFILSTRLLRIFVVSAVQSDPVPADAGTCRDQFALEFSTVGDPRIAPGVEMNIIHPRELVESSVRVTRVSNGRATVHRVCTVAI
jgi:hypothetical protein